MTDDPITPTVLFAHDEPGPRLQTKDIAATLTDMGVPSSTATPRVATHIRKNLIFAREKSVSTRPNVFAITDVAVSAVLSCLQDTGIENHDVLSAASLGLYTGHVEDRPWQADHPIREALHYTVFEGETWLFQLHFFRPKEGGDRRIETALFPEHAGLPERIKADTADFHASVTTVVLTQPFAAVWRQVVKAQRG